MRRAIFRRGLKYVAVKPIGNGDQKFQPGEELVGIKTYHLRWLWHRGRIGVEGDPWTIAQVEAWKQRLGKSVAAAAVQDYSPATTTDAAETPTTEPNFVVVIKASDKSAKVDKAGPRKVRK